MVISNTEPVEVRRCPACGQRIAEAAPESCELCGFDFGLERAATSDDTTPFAEAFTHEQPGHWRMIKWVWTAPAGRIKHLALMRSSAASRAFFFRYFLLMATALGVLLGTQHGWHEATASPSIESTGSVKPHGQGWLHVAATPNPYRTTASPATPVDLWWNVPQAVIAAVAGFVGGLIVLWLVFRLIRTGVELSHGSRYRGEGRMTAALNYSAAWFVPVLLSCVLLLFRPVSEVGGIARWEWSPSQLSLNILVGMVAAACYVLWWFWLLRLGWTAPADTRSRVEWLFGLGLPVLVAAGGAAWWFGLDYVLTHLFASWKLHF